MEIYARQYICIYMNIENLMNYDKYTYKIHKGTPNIS